MAAPLTDVELTSWLEDADVDLSDASRRSYAAHLRMLVKYGLQRPESLLPNPLVRCILRETSIARLAAASLANTSKQALAGVVLAVYKHAPAAHASAALHAAFPAWQQFAFEMEEQVHAAALSSVPSARERTASVTVPEALAMERALAATEYGSARHLLLAFYTLWPPLRGGDGGRLFIVSPTDPRATNADGPNVLVLDTRAQAMPSARVILREHKTVASCGPLVRPMPPALLAVVLHSLELQPRVALFVGPITGEPFHTESAFNAWANRELLALFGRPVTANSFRHGVISDVYHTRLATTSQLELHALASHMGHTVARQALYRRVEPPAPSVRAPEPPGSTTAVSAAAASMAAAGALMTESPTASTVALREIMARWTTLPPPRAPKRGGRQPIVDVSGY